MTQEGNKKYEVASFLRLLCAELHMTPLEFATRTGTSHQNAYQQLNRPRSTMTLARVKQIAIDMGIPKEKMLELVSKWWDTELALNQNDSPEN